MSVSRPAIGQGVAAEPEYGVVLGGTEEIVVEAIANNQSRHVGHVHRDCLRVTSAPSSLHLHDV